jgi:hypothetical protein
MYQLRKLPDKCETPDDRVAIRPQMPQISRGSDSDSFQQAIVFPTNPKARQNSLQVFRQRCCG